MAPTLLREPAAQTWVPVDRKFWSDGESALGFNLEEEKLLRASRS